MGQIGCLLFFILLLFIYLFFKSLTTFFKNLITFINLCRKKTPTRNGFVVVEWGGSILN